MTARGAEGRTFLLEVGCEEIPAAALPAALRDLRDRLLEALGGASGLGGAADEAPPFGGPRRLAACITGIRDREEDREVTVTGPPAAAAYDAAGAPTRAALGFARAQGVEVSTLTRVKGDKGEVVAARRLIAGRRAADVLAEACPRILGAMRFPKMMKWGDQGHTFVRPVHWILALLDSDPVPFEFVGIRSGRTTLGHRFLAPGPHEVASAADYESVLAERGRVIARNAARRERIRAERDRAAKAAGWTAREDEVLLEELTYLTEFPGVIAGRFPESHLSLPEPVLVTSMRHHQKYFPAEAPDGTLAAGFLAVINQESDPDGVIRRGNEWVLKARLADAVFFWAEDRKKSLEDRLPALDRVTFQEKLGSGLARSRRLESLVGRLCAAAGAAGDTAAHASLAARLSKSDLTTGMVGEFPELQGVMGGIYARLDGLPEPVARAIEDHYKPTSPDGELPAAIEACLLSLADRIDLLAGCFAIGLLPKGSSDPYGLRRAAHGVCRLLLSAPMASLPRRILFPQAVQAALEGYSGQGIQAAPGAGRAVMEFTGQRLRFMMEEDGMRLDTARAVLSAGFDDLHDAWQRAAALTTLRGPQHEADFLALASSAKRIRNILSQAAEMGIGLDGARADPKRLVDAEEKDLHAAIEGAAAEVDRLAGSRDYQAALRRIASVRPQVDRFFDKVLVMAPDERLRLNRLALLKGLSALLSRVADFSEIVVEGESTERDA